MGTDISIGVYTDLDETVAEYLALVARLMDRSEIHAIETFGFVSSSGSSHFGTEDLQPHVAKFGLEKVAKEFLYSDKPLILRLVYTLSSGREIPFDVRLYGYKYEDGIQVQVDGFIKISIALNDLIRPLRSTNKVKGEEQTQNFLSIMHDEEELIFRILGIDLQQIRRTKFPHAAAYLEMGWPSAVGCSFLFHADISEFARDYVRIFVDFHQGIQIRSSLAHNVDIWQISSTEQVSPSKKPSTFYRQFVHGDEDKDALLKFLQELDEQKVRQLAKLENSAIREAFLLAGEEIADVVCYDLGESGLALASPPYTSIWRAFQFVARLF